jgi:hypothetical protein
LELNTIEPINYDLLSRIKNNIDDETILNKIFENIEKESFDKLFQFVINNKELTLNYLFIYLKKQYNSIWNKDMKEPDFTDSLNSKSEITKDGFISYLKILPPVNIDNTIKKIFQNYYIYNKNKKVLLIENQNINLDILKKLEFKDICFYLINKLDFSFKTDNNITNINDYINEDYVDLKFIMNNGLVLLKDIDPLFENFKLELTSPIFTQNSEQVKESLTEIIDNFIMDITESIYKLKSDEYDSQKVKSFLDRLTSNRVFYFNSNNRYSDNLVYIDELRRKDEYQTNYLDFLIQIYSTTLNNTTVIQNIYSVIQKYSNLKNHFYLELLKLNKEKNSSFVKIFKDKIYEYKEYSNENYLEVLKVLFDDTKDNTQITLIIKDILDYLLKINENQVQYKFIENLLTNENLKELITSEIIKFELKDIKRFNQTLQRLTYDYLCSEDKIFDLDKNILIDMIRVNEQLYKKDILRVIKSDLPKVTKLQKVFDLIDNLTTLSNEEKTEISKELSQHSEHKKFKDNIEEYCRKLEIK